MSDRPACIVSSADAAAFDYRPDNGDGRVACRFRPLSDLAGLTQMGVKLRETPLGHASTHRHFHDTEEEWVWVLSGEGRLEFGDRSIPVRAGHFAGFPPEPIPHRFVAEGDAPLLVLEGGERRRDEDGCHYPDLGVVSRGGVDAPLEPDPSAPAMRDPIVHVDDTEERVRPHPLDANAVRHFRAVDESMGLTRQACKWVRLEAGVPSTTYHTHDRTDEWVYLLSGEADVRIGDQWWIARAGDFVAHPTGGPAHEMRARSELVYLMGGQHLPGDIVTYPERRMTLGPDGFAPLDP